MGATAPYFQRWITRIDPDFGRTRVTTASLCEPNQVDGISIIALKRAYRDAIRAAAPSTRFILLKVDPWVLQERLIQRPGHFMPPALLTSQLETLQTLETAEAGMTVISGGGIEALTDQILANLRQEHPAVPVGTDQNGR